MGTAAMLAVAVVSTYFLANVIRLPSRRKEQKQEPKKTLEPVRHERK
jgi:hypothetical protein